MKRIGHWLRASTRSQCSSAPKHKKGRPESGASAVEYGLLIAGIAALIAGVIFALGGGATGMFQDSCSTILVDTSAGSCS
jgi:pilus assembly protein Flp/PilA